MSSEFAKGSANLTAKVNAAASFAEIAEICKQDLAGGRHEDPMTPASPVADAGWGFTRVIYVGNGRFELHSSSEAGLDLQENKIRRALE